MWKNLAQKIRAPLFDNVNYSVHINWGDGKRDLISSAHDPLAVHSYEELGYYVVSFDGYYPQLGLDPNIKLNQENLESNLDLSFCKNNCLQCSSK